MSLKPPPPAAPPPKKAPKVFSWDNPEIMKTSFGLEVAGEWDIGKTHFAATFPAPAFADTELKADIVLRKFGITKWKRIFTFQDLREFVHACIEDPDVKTVVIDSGSDLRELAEAEWIEEHGGKRPVRPTPDGKVSLVLYAQVYEKIDELIREVLKAGKILVATARLKEEWIADTPTGRLVRDGYKKFPWSLHIGITLRRGIPDKTGRVHFPEFVFGEVRKNNFFGVDWSKEPPLNFKKPYLFDVSYEGVVRELLEPWGAGVPLGKEEETILREAEAWLKMKKRI